MKQKKESKVFSWPQDGDIFFWVRSDIGAICKSEWNNGKLFHAFRKATGNCFRTRAEAELAVSRVIDYFTEKDNGNGV